MNIYNPSIEPNRENWLNASESERLTAVIKFHKSSEDDLDEKALTAHSSIHVIVENQLALDVELLAETMEKLLRQGLERHEAIHAIGAVISGDILALLRGEIAEFSPKKYRRKLEKLTAKRWKKGQY
jgi:hypothetical protein